MRSQFVRRRPRLAGGLAAVGLAAVMAIAAACGGGADGSLDRVETQAGTPDASEPVTASEGADAPATTAAPFTGDVTEALEAAFTNSAGRAVRGDMRMALADLVSVTASFEVDSSQNTAMTMSLGDESAADESRFNFELRLVDGGMYVRFEVPEQMGGLGGSGFAQGWFTTDAETLAGIGIGWPSFLTPMTAPDGAVSAPNDFVDLIGFTTSAEYLGPEVLDGTETDRFRLMLDMAQMSQGHLDGSEALDGLWPSISEMLPDEVAIDVWIDADDLVRRLSMDLASFVQGLLDELDDEESEGFEGLIEDVPEVTIVMDFYDYDADIVIEAPSAEEILGDFGELTGETGNFLDSEEALGHRGPMREAPAAA